MDVRVTDAAVLDLDQDVVGARFTTIEVEGF
jgi:hypothetical protein